MMAKREHSFRGKRATDNEWIFGSLINDYSSGTAGIVLYAEMPKGTKFFGELKKCNIYQIDPETVCKYTGLTDKNGVKIFEGDILKYISENGKPEYFVVSWNDDPIRYIITETKTGCVDVLDDFVHQEMEVAGNIFDNPELMEGAEKCTS